MGCEALNHHCPVCGFEHIKVDWQTTDNNCNWWWTGHYACLSCLTIYRASGPIRMGEPVIHTWHPACRLHGTDAVVVNDQDGRSFYCIKCGRKLEVRDGCVEVMWQPPAKNQPKPQPTMEAANV